MVARQRIISEERDPVPHGASKALEDYALQSSVTGIRRFSSRIGLYGLSCAVSLAILAIVLIAIDGQISGEPQTVIVIDRTLLAVFFTFGMLAAALCWFIVMARDRRTLAEEAILHRNRLLVRDIAEHRKVDASLQEAKEAAEAANRAKSRYVVSLSHELRTPLNVISGYAQLLERDETIPPARQPVIHVIKRNADHLSGLIDGLLDISRIEAGRFEIYSDEINLADFLDQIVDMIQPQASARGIDFRHVRSEDMPGFVKTDERRLRQVLINLLSNAIKFTEAGSVVFEVSYRNQIATFSVIDTGCGISKNDLPRIFEAFQRGEQGKSVPGIGLGLTITRLLTETMGGEVSVSSEPGKGSIFRVRLMLSAVMHPRMQSVSPRRITGYDGPHRMIMVVDDDEDHRQLVRETLAPLNFTVIAAAGGEECLAMVEHSRPDIFLIDITMPGMNGWQLVKKLRSRGETGPVIVLSADIGNLSAVEGEGGHDDTLTKPFDIRQLETKIGRLLSLKWQYEKVADAPLSQAHNPILASPGNSHVRELIRLGEIGYIRGIRAKIEELAKTEANEAFAAELSRYVQNFDLAGYDRFLRTFDSEGCPDDVE